MQNEDFPALPGSNQQPPIGAGQGVESSITSAIGSLGSLTNQNSTNLTSLEGKETGLSSDAYCKYYFHVAFT
jgi:hypothetical protein